MAKLGYDPFKPHMSSSSNTGGVGPLAGGVGGGMSLPPPPPFPSSSSSSSTNGLPSSPSSSSGSGQGQGFTAPGVVPPPPNPTSSSSSLEEDLEQGERYPDLVAAVNAAMQQLLEKASPEDGDRVQTALATVDKMLGSLAVALASDRQDGAAVAKMSRVRVMNAAFQAKVASVQGGNNKRQHTNNSTHLLPLPLPTHHNTTDNSHIPLIVTLGRSFSLLACLLVCLAPGMALFQAAGFELVEEELTPTPTAATATGGSDISSNGSNSGSGQELFLKLPLDGDSSSDSLVRLRYTVARLKELLL